VGIEDYPGTMGGRKVLTKWDGKKGGLQKSIKNQITSDIVTALNKNSIQKAHDEMKAVLGEGVQTGIGKKMESRHEIK
jgi:hypothetical protein